MFRFFQIRNLCLIGALLAGAVSPKLAAEQEVQLQYPSKTDTFVLTGVAGREIVLRPRGRDTGGRAYLKMDDLLEQRAILIFPLPAAYYSAFEEMAQGKYQTALPGIEASAEPLLQYLQLAELPGNLMPTVLSYLEALQGTERWERAVAVAIQIPLAKAPPAALEALGDLALALHSAGEESALERLHNSIIAAPELGLEARGIAMELADSWRERGEHLRAFQLYRKIQLSEGEQQTLARLWVAYCSFYLGHEQIPEVFLDVLPEMNSEDYGYSLRELIKARLAMRNEDFEAAMRFAAIGKTYSNAIDPWYPELLYTVGRLYEIRSMREAARAAYREVSIMFSDSPWADESLHALERLKPDLSSL